MSQVPVTDQRPRSITIISWVFIAFGGIAFLTSLLPYVDPVPVERIAYLKAHWIVHVARIVAVVSGVFMLYGFNWSRWLLVAWIGFHIIISALHSPLQLLLHGLIFAVVLYLVFRPQASAYFRSRSTEPPPIPT
jgi:hypothetical protein